MTHPFTPGEPSQVKSPRSRIIVGAVLIGLLGIASIIVVLILLLPPLIDPPPSQSPAYDMFSSGEISTSIDPGRDGLLFAEDGQVALHIPVGAAPVAGILVMQPRDYALIPDRVEGTVERIRAVDIFMLDADGEILPSPAFDPELLLCFHLSSELDELRNANSESIMIHRFDERAHMLKWESLPVVQGWEADQICAPLNHLSILALAIDHGPEPTQTPPVERKTPTSAPEIYSIPLGPDDQ